jgi:2-keto-4-pentenoate hydratase/2-oxohepta-3-ene-1,7-dioic acid hydratase in catechol pathway
VWRSPLGGHVDEAGANDLPTGGSGLAIKTVLNGQLMQDASTSDLIFSVAELIAAATEAFSLNPGDLLISGTPGGVGMARNPPVFMKAGDRIEISIEGIGTLSNEVVDGPAFGAA